MTISARVTSAKYALSEWWKLQVFKRQHRRRLRNYGPHEAWTEMALWIWWIQESSEAESRIDPTRQHPSFPDKPLSETEVNAWRNFSTLYMRDFMAILSDVMFEGSLSGRNFPGQLWDVTFKESVRPERPKPWPDPPEDEMTHGSLKPTPRREGKSK